MQRSMPMRYIYSEHDNPLANDYYYETSYHRLDHFPIVPSHTHNFYEIYIYLAGSIKLSIEDTLYAVKKGDIIIIPPYTIHQLIVSDEPDALPYERIYTYITESCLKTFQFNEHGLLNSLHLATENKRYHFTIKDHKEFNTIYECMHQVFDNKGSKLYGTELINRANILKMMTLICRNIHEELKPQGMLHMNPLIENILSYINSNYNDDISMDSLAERFYVNKSTLAKEFKNQTAQTIHSYLIMKRISVAKQEMSSGIPPSQAYLLTGFKEYSTFYRTFLKFEGISPKTFYQNCQMSD